MERPEAAPVDIDPDFEPQARPRSCTWPLPRPELSVVQPAIPSEEGRAEPPDAPSPLQAEDRGLCDGLPGAAAPRKGGSRRNAWGNQSYAELISQAIESSTEKRLTLSQIYEWMVKTIPYFKDKGDSNSSAGWKNSIRHNLSLHSKFIKVHNEATGKSSWWMLNPEGGKSGKAPRRRAASMDNSSKLAKVRSKVSKKKAQSSGESTAGSPGSQPPKWPGSPSSRSGDDPDVWTSFRPRTGSNASNLSLRLSPILTEPDDVGDEDLHSSLSFSNSVPPTVSEELELIDSLTMLSSGAPLPAPQPLIQVAPNFSMHPPQTLSFGNSLFGPTDTSPVRGPSGRFQRPQTLEALLTSDSPPPSDVMMTQVDPVLGQSGGPNLLMLGGLSKGRTPDQLNVSLNTLVPPNTPTMIGLSSPSSMPPPPKPNSFGTTSDRLPTDLDMDMILENLECDMEYIINNELMDEGGLDFNFESIHPGTNQNNNHSWVPS
ncbi:forkhead box protein O4 isoform 2-T2 [Anomaloglossus baeobatrachus]|uniref:forkhead box protein O4 isoform X2 n=1 Tax=Anomaloglossus baeobatrachus TaxID=238106 RepID=UPI003F508469